MRPVVSRLVVALVGSVLAAALLAACGGSNSPISPGPGTGASVTVNVSSMGEKYPMSHADLIAGMSRNAVAWLTLAGAARQICTTGVWTSSNPLIATVTSGGKIDAIPAGTATIYATCAGATGTATVTVYDQGALSGTVRNESGATLEGADVELSVNIMGPFIGSNTALTDATGHYRITGAASGHEYSVGVTKNGYESLWTTVTLAGPETQQDFTLKTGFNVYGTVTEAGVGPLQGVTVAVTSGVNTGKTQTTDSYGKYFLQHMLPGRFTLQASKAGYDSVEQTIDTSVGLAVDFVLKSSYGSCLISVNPLIIDRFASAGGTATINVTGAPGRTWTASSDQPWIQVASGGSGTGAGQVLLQLLPAAAGAADVRNGNVRVGCGPAEGQTIQVSQLPDCAVTLSWAAGSPTTFPATLSGGSVDVKTGTPGCHVWYVSLNDWITTTGVRDWYGNGNIGFIVQPNTTGAPRTGAIVVGEKKWEITQAGQ